MYKSHILLFITGMLLCISSCTKVDHLSDEAKIESFKIINQTEGINLDPENIQIVNNVVSIPVEFGRKNFPLKIQAEIDFSSTTEDVISVNDQPLNLKEFTFTDVYTPCSFYLISESGVPHLGKIILKDKLNAEIEQFKIKNYTGDVVRVITRNNNIRIQFMNLPEWPITIVPEITKTPTAQFKDYTENTSFVFENPADVKHITLLADNGDERVWNVQIVPSIENSDFEKWVNTGTSKVNIDPVPGEGYGWATANNPFVQGTQPIEHNGGYAAQMTTDIQNLQGLGLGQLITAGTIFTGHFVMDVGSLDNPPAMTFFSIPFITRPSSVSLQAKYVAGVKFQQSVKGKNGYELQDLNGIDQGRMWVKVMNWTGKEDLKYHEKDIPGLTILGEGELIFDGAETSINTWRSYQISLKYNPAHAYLEPTHIAIVATSSRQGDVFIGAKGSTLTIDNVNINY